MTTTYPCPHCGAPASLDGGCPACGAGPDPDAAEVIRIDGELGGLQRELQAARTLVADIDRRIQDARGRRSQLAARVVARRAPVVTTPPPSFTPPQPAEPRLSTLTVQNVLFTLGGLLLVVAAAVFTAVAWAQVGVTGRALLLAGATVAILAVPPFAVRRGLTSAAETLAAVGLLMILLDGYAAWAVDFLGVHDLQPTAYAAAVLAVTALVSLGYSWPTRLHGPRIAALLLAQPVLPLLAAAAEADLAGWSLAFTGTLVLDVAVLRIRPSRFATDMVGALAHVCGALAAVAAGVVALTHLVVQDAPADVAVAGVVLVLPTLALLGWAVLARIPLAQAITAGLALVAVGVAATGWAWSMPGTGWPVTELAVVTLLLAAVAALLKPRLPVVAGRGPWVGALVAGGPAAVTVLLGAASGAVRSMAAATPVFAAPWDRAVTGPGRDMLVALVVTAVAYALLVPRRTHPDLALTTLFGAALLAPPVFGLTWWAAAVAGMAVAAVALVLAARSRTLQDAVYRVAVCVFAALHAILTGLGQAGAEAAVCGAIALLGLGTAVALRNAPRSADVGAGSVTAGLLAAPPAVWLALYAGDVPVTARVRVSLAVAVLLCLAAHAVARRLPGYGPNALGVALLAAATAPFWSLPGTDPSALYAAAGLLLVVALLPLPAARSGAGAVAALLPAGALLVLIAPDLAVIVLEPWTALDDGVWSGVLPRQSPVAWSSVAALAGATLAAALTGLLLARFRPPARLTPATTSPTASAPPAIGGSTNGSTPPANEGSTTGSAPGIPGETDSGAATADIGSKASAEDAAGATRTVGGGSPVVVAVWAAAPLVALLVPLILAAAGAAWPAVPIAALITGLAGMLAVAFAPVRHRASDLLTILFGVLVAAGLAGSTAGHGATIAAFTLVAAASTVAGLLGRRPVERLTGWAAGPISLTVVAYTIAVAADLEPAGPPLFVLAAAALTVALEAVLASRRPAEAIAPFVVGHASAVVALTLTESLGWAALICKLWALALTVRAMRPGETRRTRFRYALAAGSVALLGWWLLLSSRDVETVEIYTLPAAVLAVIAGWFARRYRSGLSSWTAYGSALGAAILPSLYVVAASDADDPQYLRRLLLGAGALLILLAGARARLQAPVLIGGGTLLLVALHELIQVWDLVPRWVPLAVGGLLLVGIATTMEQRRRDLARLRDAITRMT
ncbi:hypothetical protein FHR83_001507 [Actinoplanes campanulatus]|uniref:Uncharacterized protein n=1 Tax=Actinoplanes campanulatus TaxID=113559 RepID=A0A7W5ACU3_9ACTN|nr:hypothetical protein [Actinoplanes campanulatus]MBB3093858.1 hypothetical protein [Actinoplanes campanulatus]GGN06111.1 hypothetical protein GCM10010109_13780 [Actinoplanes campanulatus]GID35067.1 hypothetical protein Aca09nite_15730 [Actinoplanes campanulatus]